MNVNHGLLKGDNHYNRIKNHYPTTSGCLGNKYRDYIGIILWKNTVEHIVHQNIDRKNTVEYCFFFNG